jgi:MFS transporter, PPP family, 3-phenylpropionic acid transporter
MSARSSLAAWYFAYFAFIGSFLPYFSLYLESVGRSPAEIGILMSIGQVVRVLVPALWGWLSDRSGKRTPIIRWSAVLSVLGFSAYFVADTFPALLLATLLLHLFWTGALPLVEALTFQHLHDVPERYGRIRLWGSLGFIASVSGVGALLDVVSIGSLLWIGLRLLQSRGRCRKRRRFLPARRRRQPLDWAIHGSGSCWWPAS